MAGTHLAKREGEGEGEGEGLREGSHRGYVGGCGESTYRAWTARNATNERKRHQAAAPSAAPGPRRLRGGEGDARGRGR